MIKLSMENLGNDFLKETTDCLNRIIFIQLRIEFDKLNLKIVQIIMGPIW